MLPDGQASNPSAVVQRITAAMADERYPSGRRAELRRLEPTAPGGAFWGLLLRVVPEALGDDEAERRWAVVIRGIAVMEAVLRGEREPPAMGIALARAAVAELRFLKLLRSSEDALPDELRRLARLMASRNQPFDWTDAWWLLATAGTPDAPIRRKIARDYYRARAALDATPSKDAA